MKFQNIIKKKPSKDAKDISTAGSDFQATPYYARGGDALPGDTGLQFLSSDADPPQARLGKIGGFQLVMGVP